MVMTDSYDTQELFLEDSMIGEDMWQLIIEYCTYFYNFGVWGIAPKNFVGFLFFRRMVKP